jgi:type IV secretion system protein VirB5
MRSALQSLAFASIVVITPLTANAGIPVIDVTAIANLIQQVTYWQQQLVAMTNQLTQLQQTNAALTGTRGMQSVLPMSDLQRNYLPPDYAELMNTVNGRSTTYAGLSTQIESAMAANAVLSNAQLAGLDPDTRQVIENARRSTALLTSITQSAYQNTSQRFAALQRLIVMIGAARDAKAIQDLQSRVSAEQAMLTNEQTKLQSLYQITQANHSAQQQRIREQVISGHGGFSSRFAPTP